MIVQRRRFLHLAAGAAALPAVSQIADAQGYPSRTVRMVVGFPPGQAIDISARLMAEWLAQRLGQTFIIENRPGAAANVATEMVARSPADGYTLLIISSNNVINTTLYGTVDFAHEIAPIATFGRGYQVLNVNNSLPVKTVPDLIAFAKATIEVLKMPDVQRRFRALNVEPDGRTPAETAAFIKEEARRWGEVIRANNIMTE